MKKLLQTTATITTTEIVLIIVALIKNKYLALSIGPEGFGIYGLLLSFFNLAAVFSGTWLSTGATKYMSEYSAQNDDPSTQKVYSFTIGVSSIIAVSMTIVMFLASTQIREIFLSPDVLSIYFLLFAAAFIGNSLRPVFLSILQGLRKIRIVVYSRILIAIFEIISIITLVYFLDLMGFMIGVFISSVFSVIIFGINFKKLGYRVSFKYILVDDVSIKLLKFGGVNIFLAFGNLGAQYLQRKIILLNMDIISVGLLQAAVSIRNYSDVVGRGSGFYFLPRMSERINKSDRVREINDYMYFSIVTYFIIGMSLLLFKNEIVTILLSAEFVAVSSVLGWFIIAELLHNMERPLGQAIIGMAALRTHTANTIFVFLSWIIVPIIYAPSFGIKSIALGSIAGSVFSMFNSGIKLRREINYIYSIRNIVIGLISLISLVYASSADHTFTIRSLILLIIIGICILTMKTSEKDRLRSVFKKYFSKYRIRG